MLFPPTHTPIELWDSGMPVLARSGENLQTIAAFHHVPLWSLTQINQTSDSVPLVRGQRVIVPRHLAPLANSLRSRQAAAVQALTCGTSRREAAKTGSHSLWGVLLRNMR